jgi:hypothetical protein
MSVVAPFDHDVLPQARQPSGMLGRRCACGGHVIGGGECAQCRARRLAGETAGKRAAPVRESAAPTGTRTQSGPSLGHDLSSVLPTKAAVS